ncbi:hypothetical protein [Almyronema epifaneia]|uniref:Transcriptional regulator n=1 Tax=Almyronema epifaneia S1 TaxID=2991925 RepID=A0ABW6IF15_9CYAN
MEITTLELKFLMRLLAQANYHAPLSQISLNAKTSAAQRETVCRQLGHKGLVAYTEVISRFGLTPGGRLLLNLDNRNLLVTPDELLTLKSAATGHLSPATIHPKVPAQSRQRLIQTLASRKLVKISQKQIKDVWLTPQGQHFLRFQYSPQGHDPALTLTMLGDYLKFMRQPATPDSLNSK